MDIDTIRSRIAEHGLSYRGAFHAEAPGKTLVLVGFVGAENWSAFTASPEAADGRGMDGAHAATSAGTCSTVVAWR